MLNFYRIFLFLYRIVITLASPFHAKAQQAIHDRKASLKELYSLLERNYDPIVWFHAASMGEFEQGLPVMKAFKAAYPKKKLLVTFFSPSGYLHRKDHPIIDFAAYLPWDSPSNARKFISAIQPSAVFFIKYEFWFYFLKTIHYQSIPLFSISARFVKDQVFFKWYGGLHRQMLNYFDHIFVQNKASLALVKNIGIQKVSYSGDTRFDNVMHQVKSIEPLERIAEFKGDHQLFIIGSAWLKDIEVLASFLRNGPEDLKILIAPHDISKSNIEKMSTFLNQPFCLFTDHSKCDHSVMFLDTIGQLFKAYQYADLVYIGGAFGDGLHNILEATAYGTPVVFGNGKLEKFPEANQLLERKGAFAINDQKDAEETLSRLYQDKNLYEAYSQNCIAFMIEMGGATERIMKKLKETL